MVNGDQQQHQVANNGFAVTAADKDEVEDVPMLCSQRWTMAYTGFFGFAIVIALRVNLSVGVICMLKTPNATSTADNTTETLDTECIAEYQAFQESNDRAELDWSASTKYAVLASFYYGYLVTQIPGGLVADRYGGKRVLGSAIGLSSALTLLLPVCARTSVYLVYAIRVAVGLLTGVAFPAMHAIWGRWAPPLERSKLTTFTYAGTAMGNILTFTTSGLLCAYGFDNGWGSIFYVSGGLGVLWTVVWFYVAADTPSKHPRISEAEVKYITSRIEYKTEVKTESVPWLSIAKSPCLWAVLTAHVCNNWTNYTLLTNIPTFMKEVLKFEIKQNGGLSAVPYVCKFVSATVAGQLADFLRTRQIMSTTVTRKTFQILSFAGAGACLVATGFASCHTREVAVVMLSLAVMFTGIGRAGYDVNHIDFAPKYAGVLYGITNTCATLPGMIAPIVAGILTPNNLQTEWRNVFYLCAAFDAFGILVFGAFASGELQDWAKDKDEETVVPDDSDLDKSKLQVINQQGIELDAKTTTADEKFTVLSCHM